MTGTFSNAKKPHRQLVLIKGAGDLATGVAHRLHRAGFKVVMTEQEQPTVIRRPVAFARAVFDTEVEVEGVRARKIEPIGPGSSGQVEKQTGERLVNNIYTLIDKGIVPVVIDPRLQLLSYLKPGILIEGTLSKKNTGIGVDLAPLVLALGPGYQAGRDVHALVETRRGHDLGRVIYSGEAIPNDGIPGPVEGYSSERLIKAPASGLFQAGLAIGDLVSSGDLLGRVETFDIRAAISGVVRGLIQDGFTVKQGMKIGDIDPRGIREYCFSISDKARAVAGGVLEAILYFT